MDFRLRWRVNFVRPKGATTEELVSALSLLSFKLRVNCALFLQERLIVRYNVIHYEPAIYWNRVTLVWIETIIYYRWTQQLCFRGGWSVKWDPTIQALSFVHLWFLSTTKCLSQWSGSDRLWIPIRFTRSNAIDFEHYEFGFGMMVSEMRTHDAN